MEPGRREALRAGGGVSLLALLAAAGWFATDEARAAEPGRAAFAAKSLELADTPLTPPLVTTCDYGGGFVAAVENGPLCATQFHPEKSGDAGAGLLRAWVRSIG